MKSAISFLSWNHCNHLTRSVRGLKTRGVAFSFLVCGFFSPSFFLFPAFFPKTRLLIAAACCAAFRTRRCSIYGRQHAKHARVADICFRCRLRVHPIERRCTCNSVPAVASGCADGRRSGDWNAAAWHEHFLHSINEQTPAVGQLHSGCSAAALPTRSRVAAASVRAGHGQR